MGSTTLIDILGSMMVGGLLLLVALRMNDTVTKNTFDCQEQLTVQQNMTFLTEAIGSDFRKIGYNANPLVPFNQGQYITYADTSNIRFLADLDKNGTYDTVQWVLGPVVNPVSGARELDRMVRAPGGSVRSFSYRNVGVTRFFMQYFAASPNPDSSLQVPGIPITGSALMGNPIQMVELTIAVVPTAAYDTAYYSNISVWRQKRLVSMNLRGR